MKRVKRFILSVILTISCLFGSVSPSYYPVAWATTNSNIKYTVNNVPVFSGLPYVEIDGNIPSFKASEMITEPFEKYTELDELGRCGVAYANICKEIMPTEARGSIGMVKPSGWQTIKYDFVDGKYLYNRCHLIGYQLAGENANVKNLITGTRYLNIVGMLEFENTVSAYIEENPKNHVLYRVTPIFKGKNLLASGVQIEAYSVEDNGRGVSFNVYCYNAQPGVEIDYRTGDSKISDSYSSQAIKVNTDSYTLATVSEPPSSASASQHKYVLNKNTKKFHTPDCQSVSDMKEKNKEYFDGTREEALERGYSPCKRCNP